jgi:hypothetical protein
LGAILRIVTILTVVMGFSLAHLHLRFSLNRVRAEEIRLQTLQGTLVSDLNALRGETESLKRPERLYDFARGELGMVEYNPAQRQTLRMPEDVYSRYAMARAAGERDLAAHGQPRQAEVWLQAMGDQIGLIGQALAREPGARN